MQRFFRILVLAITAVILTGCWLPDDFAIDLNIRGDGKYAFRYVGDLTAIPMLRTLSEEKPNQKEEQELAEVYRQELMRDSGYEEVTYLGQARFKIRYTYKGDIVENPTFYFVRSNSKVIAMTQANAVVTIRGDRPPEAYRKELIAKGFDIKGVVRVWTDQPVISSNATAQVNGAPKRYEWQIDSMEQPAPNMQIRINRTIPVTP